MKNESQCPACNSESIYPDSNLWVCAECSHEWRASSSSHDADLQGSHQEHTVRDAYGIVLNNGDSVTVIKDLKVKGSSLVVKVGTKVKSIRLIEGEDGHDIACKIDKVGSINLKSEFVKKS